MTFKLPNDPFFIGFDKFFEGMVEVPKETNYPPYNILKITEDRHIIEVAVAGINEKDINIVFENGTLTVEGKPSGSSLYEKEGAYLHKGISNRAFKRQWKLAEHNIVRKATMENGLLSIVLDYVVPEDKKPVKIEIGGDCSCGGDCAC